MLLNDAHIIYFPMNVQTNTNKCKYLLPHHFLKFLSDFCKNPIGIGIPIGFLLYWGGNCKVLGKQTTKKLKHEPKQESQTMGTAAAAVPTV